MPFIVQPAAQPQSQGMGFIVPPAAQPQSQGMGFVAPPAAVDETAAAWTTLEMERSIAKQLTKKTAVEGIMSYLAAEATSDAKSAANDAAAALTQQQHELEVKGLELSISKQLTKKTAIEGLAANPLCIK